MLVIYPGKCLKLIMNFSLDWLPHRSSHRNVNFYLLKIELNWFLSLFFFFSLFFALISANDKKSHLLWAQSEQRQLGLWSSPSTQNNNKQKRTFSTWVSGNNFLYFCFFCRTRSINMALVQGNWYVWIICCLFFLNFK